MGLGEKIALLKEMKEKAIQGAVGSPVAGMAKKPIGVEEIQKATTTLIKYKDGKANFDRKIVENEQWYRLQHWDLTETTSNNGTRKTNDERPKPTSAWLLNSLTNKHADAMDNYPEPNVLPREQADEEDANKLSSIIPVVLERSHFEQTYSNAWWYKLKHGCVPYGVFWDNSLGDGLGDISIKQLDLLNMFWEPGKTDIQDSQNIFVCTLMDNDVLAERYPELKNKEGGKTIDIQQYVYDDKVDTTDKSVVVDWYYKKQVDNRTILHFCKFVGQTVLFATENEPQQYPNGLYNHGKYPFVFDVLFPEAGTPVGFGYLDTMKSPQIYIDKLSQVVLENAIMSTKVRYMVKKSAGINIDQFMDWSKPLVEVEGSMSDENIRPINVPGLSPGVLNVLQQKIDELKETSSNRDVSQGSSSGGVTAAAAIAALQEAGNKTSRDMISASYRAYTELNYLVIELIRQFYTETREFRITGSQGKVEFVQFNNEQMQGKPINGDPNSVRMPIFDIVIKPQRKSAYSRMAQNELAKELYGLGVFEPERATPALTLLDMMQFDGDEKIKQKVEQEQTMEKMIMELSQLVQQQAAELASIKGMAMPMPAPEPQREQKPVSKPTPKRKEVKAQETAQKSNMPTNMTNYGKKMAANAKPDMNR